MFCVRLSLLVPMLGVALAILYAGASQEIRANENGVQAFPQGAFSFAELLFADVAVEKKINATFPGYSLLPVPSRKDSDLDVGSELVPSETTFAPIYRGSNLSDLAIDPFKGRFFGYMNAAWAAQESQRERAIPGFNASFWGGGIGQDWAPHTTKLIWGYAAQGNQTRLESKGNGYDDLVDSLVGQLHTSVYDALWRLEVSLGTARNWHKQMAKDGEVVRFASDQWTLETEFGARWDKGYTRIEPRVNLRILNLIEPERAESLYKDATKTQEFSDASYRLKIGSRFSWEYETRSATIKPYLNVDWAHEFGDREIYTIGDDSVFPIAYRYGGYKMARDRLDLGGGINSALRDTCDVYLQYDVQFAQDYSEYFLNAGFNKKF